MEIEVTVRAAAAKDVAAFLRLQQGSPEALQWEAEDYSAKLGHPTTLALVAESGSGEGVVGFLFGQVTAGEMEILNFAVEAGWRRRDLGRKVLLEGLAQAARRGARRCWLEVRASNHAALLFYGSMGFAESYRRQQYYSGPPEDAVVCSRDITAPEG